MYVCHAQIICKSFKKKDFKDDLGAKIGLYDIVQSTPMESNKSLVFLSLHGFGGGIHHDIIF